jgi:hypothetical protein
MEVRHVAGVVALFAEIGEPRDGSLLGDKRIVQNLGDAIVGRGGLQLNRGRAFEEQDAAHQALHVVFALLLHLLQAVGQVEAEALDIALIEKILKHHGAFRVGGRLKPSDYLWVPFHKRPPLWLSL